MAFLKDGVSNNDKIRCLVLTRKFLPESKVRDDGFDEATLDYDETLDFLKTLNDAIRQTGLDIQLVVKPHPREVDCRMKKFFVRPVLRNMRLIMSRFTNYYR